MNTFPPSMLVKSISVAAANATVSPGTLQPWVDEVEAHVRENGKFTKSQVLYFPLSPPPVFWDYKCRKCRFWQGPNGCRVVEGEISPRGWCLTPDTRILTPNGPRAIEGIRPGDLVFSWNNKLEEVTVMATSQRWVRQEVIHIKPHYLPLLRLTPNHKIDVVRYKYTRRGGPRGNPQWTELLDFESLSAGDLYNEVRSHSERGPFFAVIMPIDKRAEVWPDGLDDKACDFLGWYAAEGSRFSKSNRGVTFTLGVQEYEVAARLKSFAEKRFGSTVHIREKIDRRIGRGKVITVRCRGTDIQKFVEQYIYGHNALEKRLAGEMQRLPIRLQSAFMDSWITGDGYKRKDGWHVSTASLDLAIQGQQMLLRAGQVTSFRRESRKRTIKINGREIRNAHPLFGLTIAKEGHLRVHKEEDFVAVPLHQNTPERGVSSSEYEGIVCNIQTPLQNYVTASGVVHNCAIWLPPADKPAFSWPNELMRGDW